MSHFAKVLCGTVTHVIVAEQEFFDTFIDDSAGMWLQTSYNTQGGIHLLEGVPLRKNYASIGDTYDHDRDAFMAPKPFPSWVLVEDSCQWEPPTPYPTDSLEYTWDEPTKSWVLQA